MDVAATVGGYLLAEKVGPQKEQATITESTYQALNRERKSANTAAKEYEKQLYNQGLIEEDDLWYYDAPAQ